jgi:tetrahydromethanopterin S-methyltransferase subunit G
MSLFLLVIPNLAKAQSVGLYKLPYGTRVHTGELTYQCFDLGQYKELLLIDNDLKRLELEEPKKDITIGELTKQVALLEMRTSLSEKEVNKVENRLDEKHEKLVEVTSKYVSQNDRLHRLRVITYSIAITALVVGFGGGVVAMKVL